MEPQPILQWIWDERTKFRIIFIEILLFIGIAYFAQESFDYTAAQSAYYSLSILCTVGEYTNPEDAPDSDFIIGNHLCNTFYLI